MRPGDLCADDVRSEGLPPADHLPSADHVPSDDVPAADVPPGDLLSVAAYARAISAPGGIPVVSSINRRPDLFSRRSGLSFLATGIGADRGVVV